MDAETELRKYIRDIQDFPKPGILYRDLTPLLADPAALRLAGCQVIDIQATTKPCFWFAVEHLQAAASIFVTGAGCDPSSRSTI